MIIKGARTRVSKRVARVRIARISVISRRRYRPHMDFIPDLELLAYIFAGDFTKRVKTDAISNYRLPNIPSAHGTMLALIAIGLAADASRTPIHV